MISLTASVLQCYADSQPNVVVILTDDQGWGDLSVNGNNNLSTPNIDSLAKDGASFDRFFVCPVCSPTRAEFLTGRYHARSGVYSTSAGGERMDLDEVTIADTFRAGGYATGAFGKWHNGMQYPYHPNGRGFDEYYGFCSGHWGDYFSPPLERNGKIVKGDGFCIDDFTNRAMEFMQQSVENDKPFFAYLPYNTPHSPMQVPDEYWNRFKDKELKMHNRDPRKEVRNHLLCALAMCENIDWNVGRILTKLDQLKIADNTIILYFCDNGPNGTRWNGDMKGRKGSTDEGGVRSPMLIRWPGHIPGGKVVKPIGAAIDLLPTLADFAGLKLTNKKPLDGRSLKPLLTGEDSDWKNRELMTHWKSKYGVRTERYRLDNNGRLFDIQSDPGQRTDISKKLPELTARLKKKVADYKQEVAGYDKDQRPFLIGNANYRYTQVPARDANGSGGIKRSNKFPNCSFLSNWTSTDEQITWQARVAASGKYRVDLHYTCPAEDVGSQIELSFGNRKLSAKITKAHDPPIRGDENDRFKRVESYVKDFRSMPLGTIELQEGEGTLTLSATEIPGSQVMDFRLLMFTKVD